MTILVTDSGFAAAPADPVFVPLGQIAANGTVPAAVDLAATDDPAALAPHLGTVRAVRIGFAAFSDGRGFTLAKRLRELGYTGRLRAAGHVIADQYAMARRSGFDEVEISADLAARQPEDQWLARADWRAHDYQARLRG